MSSQGFNRDHLAPVTALLSDQQSRRWRHRVYDIRLGNIIAETGMVKLATQGLGARCVMIGSLTAGQFGIFDVVMNALSSEQFHYNPSDTSGHCGPAAFDNISREAEERIQRQFCLLLRTVLIYIYIYIYA